MTHDMVGVQVEELCTCCRLLATKQAYRQMWVLHGVDIR